MPSWRLSGLDRSAEATCDWGTSDPTQSFGTTVVVGSAHRESWWLASLSEGRCRSSWHSVCRVRLSSAKLDRFWSLSKVSEFAGLPKLNLKRVRWLFWPHLGFDRKIQSFVLVSKSVPFWSSSVLVSFLGSGSWPFPYSGIGLAWFHPRSSTSTALHQATRCTASICGPSHATAYV